MSGKPHIDDKGLLEALRANPEASYATLADLFHVHQSTISFSIRRLLKRAETDSTIRESIAKYREVLVLRQIAAARACGRSSDEENVLALLYTKPGITPKELASRLRISLQTLTSYMRNIEGWARKDTTIANVLENHRLAILGKRPPILGQKEEAIIAGLYQKYCPAGDELAACLRVAKLTLSNTMCRLLELLDAEPGIAAADIVSRLDLPRNALVKGVHRLKALKGKDPVIRSILRGHQSALGKKREKKAADAKDAQVRTKSNA